MEQVTPAEALYAMRDAARAGADGINVLRAAAAAQERKK